jgi:hypothetical protein
LNTSSPTSTSPVTCCTAFAKSLSQLDLAIDIFEFDTSTTTIIEEETTTAIGGEEETRGIMRGKRRIGRAVLLHGQVAKQRHEDLALPVIGGTLDGW